MSGIYLDYNASAPIDSRVLNVMIDVYKNTYGNADSRTHDYGEQARKVVAEGRKYVADLLGVNSDEVFFTSGATESNNMALLGLSEYAEQTGKKHIITTAIEHKAILNAAKHMEKQGFIVEYIRPKQSGRIDIDDVVRRLRDDTLLVSVMHANNETGVIQPIKEIGDLLEDTPVMFHTDTTQTCGKLVEEIRELKYDMMSIAAHKMYGPQGIGALILRKKKYRLPPIKPILFGGSQEHGIRPGTTPVALTAGFGEACRIANEEYGKNMQEYEEVKKTIIHCLRKSGLKYTINGIQEYCMPTTLNICLEGVMSEALMIATKQYCGISNGSACNSKSYDPSYVLTAMGMPVTRIESSIRISWGHGMDTEEIETDFCRLLDTAKSMIN